MTPSGKGRAKELIGDTSTEKRVKGGPYVIPTRRVGDRNSMGDTSGEWKGGIHG